MRQWSLLWVVLSCAALCACQGRGERVEAVEADTLTQHATCLTLAELPGGFVAVDIAPEGAEGRRISYLLAQRDSSVPEALTQGRTLVRVPLQRVAVGSSVYTSAMAELGALEALTAAIDAAYFAPGDTVSRLLADGRIVDGGSSQAPDVERLAAAGVEAVLRSPVAGQQSGQIPPQSVAIECVDYLETIPAARAEWILLLGELFDRRDQAQAIFQSTVARYDSIAAAVAHADSPRPKILVETEYSGVWYVPAGESYMARMYADAGADYPWADSAGTGSLALNLESVAAKALDADLWLVRSYGYEATPATLTALNPRYASFKALKEGKVYGCDSSLKPVFDDAAFHPDRLLAEYAAIFHPEMMPGYKLQYFNTVNDK